MTPATAVDCLVNENREIQKIALGILSTKPRTLYEHIRYPMIKKEHPELVAKLFDLITDKMIDARSGVHIPSQTL